MLERVGLAIEIAPADIDEREHAGEAPDAYVVRIARGKAATVAARLASPGGSDGGARWVLAADTTVTIDGAILGKAETPEEAGEMLRRLSGRTHQVLTGFVILGLGLGDSPRENAELVTTDVSMIEVSAEAIADYVATNEWRGKAGAYAIQGIAAAFVREVRGSVTNVAGLPLAEVLAALRLLGAATPRFAAGNPS